MATSTTGSYECDTLPAPRFTSGPTPDQDHGRSPSPLSNFRSSSAGSSPPSTTLDPVMYPTQTTQRKLCVRHQRMADEDTNLKLQQVCVSSSRGAFVLIRFSVSRCSPCTRARSCKCYLVRLLFLIAP